MEHQVPWHARLRIGLAAKLAVSLVLSTVALFTLFGYLNLRLQRRQSEEMVLQSVDRIGDLIQRSSRYEMLRNDRDALYEVIQTIGSQAGIRRIRIFNKEGRISFSTDPSEVNKLVDKRAEACYACHSQSQPLAKLNRPDRARVFTDAQGHRVLGSIRPIENDSTCSNASCHAHPPDRRILGVIDTDLSLDTVDAQVAQHQARLAEFTGAAVLLMSLVSVAFIWLEVHKPIKDLTNGIRQVAQGDLDHTITIHSRDELGVLADSFNKMTGEAWIAQQAVDRGPIRIGLAHGSLRTRDDLPADDHLIARHAAHDLQLDYLALGHWHRRQLFAGPDGALSGLRIPASMSRCGFQEAARTARVGSRIPAPTARNSSTGAKGRFCTLQSRGQAPRRKSKRWTWAISPGRNRAGD